MGGRGNGGWVEGKDWDGMVWVRGWNGMDVLCGNVGGCFL